MYKANYTNIILNLMHEIKCGVESILLFAKFMQGVSMSYQTGLSKTVKRQVSLSGFHCIFYEKIPEICLSINRGNPENHFLDFLCNYSVMYIVLTYIIPFSSKATDFNS